MCLKLAETFVSALLSQKGFRIVIESNKVVITKSGDYVGNYYISDGLFKLNVISSLSKLNSSSPHVLHVVSGTTWHEKHGHINSNTIKRMMNADFTPSSD